MATEYCDAYTYKQVYGHEPPTDGSLDPALSGTVMGTATQSIETKVVAPADEDRPKPKRTRTAQTK